jgi:hypothetical protein
MRGAFFYLHGITQIASRNVFTENGVRMNVFVYAKYMGILAELKLGYPNSVIQNYTAHKVLKEGKTSYKSANGIHKAINKLISLKWAYMEGDNLILESKKNIHKGLGVTKYIHYIKIDTTKFSGKVRKSVKDYILQEAVATKVSQQRYVKLKKVSQGRKFKSMNKHQKSAYKKKCASESIKLSMKGVAKAMGYRSLTSASKHTKTMLTQSVVKHPSKRIYFGKKLHREFLNISRNIYYGVSGYVYIPCTRWSL